MENVKVMLVDDSSVTRGFIRNILKSRKHISITSSANNGLVALELLDSNDPDIVILDLEMPIMDGLTAIPLLLEKKPSLKILICSAISVEGAKSTLKALELGASDYLAKPSSNNEIYSSEAFREKLLGLVDVLCTPSARPKISKVTKPKPKIVPTVKPKPASRKQPKVICIGSSTGGPQALPIVLKHLRNVRLPILVTQHMPKTFTMMFAKQLENKCNMPCHEARDDLPVKAGNIIVAQGGAHMKVVLKDGQPVIKLDDGPIENFCKPSIDPTMNSLIEIYGENILGVMLTGMGHDGLNSYHKLSNLGGEIIIQDKETSVVWGMPGAIADKQFQDKELPIEDIGPYILETLK